jgi:transposase
VPQRSDHDLALLPTIFQILSVRLDRRAVWVAVVGHKRGHPQVFVHRMRMQVLHLSPEVQTVYALLQAFLSIVRERKHQDLHAWMEQAISSGIAELGSFVMVIERDYDAVYAALHLPWSQGITEGKVNKLKTLKRVMYGRAGFALLRQRLLHDG